MKKDYFADSEFLACTPSCKKSDLNPIFLSRLNDARALAGVPFRLTSAYRSPDWDKSRGRSGRGFHTLRLAVDVSCTDGKTRAIIVNACLACGLSVGVARTFIHIDGRPNQTLFVY